MDQPEIVGTGTRRDFLGAAAAAAAALVTSGTETSSNAAEDKRPSLARAVGLTTGSLTFQQQQGTLSALTLPKFVRDELGMKLIDLNTRWLESYDESYLQRVRQATDDAECFITNLKVNHAFGDLYAPDAGERKSALEIGRHLIKVAKLFGARWIRFTVPRFSAGDPADKLAAHRELAKFARDQGIELLVENNGWMRSDPDSMTRVVQTIGPNAAPCPDTGNWDDGVRYAALAKAFPGAASCDFKVFELDADRQHQQYDIRRCFEIGWQAGFRGPWAIEHWNEDLTAFARETVYIKDLLQQWMSAT